MVATFLFILIAFLQYYSIEAMQGNRVILGMSGGIDSTVAALLLRQQKYSVVGITFRLWSETDDINSTHEPLYLIEARELANKLGIEHHVVDVRQYFYDQIIQYFINGYLNGKTPNPCAKCNVVLKWKLLEEYGKKLDCNYIATGHYVQVEQTNHGYFIKPGTDPDKEQSFFLWGLSSQTLSKAIFPLGKLTKSEVRQIAIENGFEQTAKKPESIGVCFIHQSDYRPFLTTMLQKAGISILPGNYCNNQGQVMGHHNGYPFYTIGQRRGLNLNINQPLYVTKIDAATNQVTLGSRTDLYCTTMQLTQCHFNYLPTPDEVVITRIRYRKQAALSTLEFLSNTEVRVHFTEPEWSIAPGQTAAFYLNNLLIGGGFIK